MKILFIALTLALSPLGYAGLCDGARSPTIAEQLANLELKTELDLINLDLFEGGSVVSGYQYEVEPAYNNGLYARTDSWKIGVSTIPTTANNLADDLTATFGLGMKFSAEASFIRFFNNPCKAETVKPYTPKRIPLKAKTAIGSQFKIGDYFIFKSRKELVRYFKTVRKSLNKQGIFCIDIFGGPESQKLVTDTKKMKGLTYYWECQHFNPLTHDCTFAIHFKDAQGKKHENVFTYNWRFWTMPELKDILLEAGFAKVVSYWEGDDDDGGGNGEFEPAEESENCDAWVCYMVGLT